MAVQIQVRRGTAAAWTAANPIMLSGEIGYETDTGKWKVGDGAIAWVSLAYAGTAGPTGPTGPAALSLFIPGDDGEDGYIGPPGPAGPTGGAGTVLESICNGRLTLTSGTPVTSADVTAATTIYFSPYAGRYIGLYDGSSTWTLIAFTETSLALGTLTAALPYDVFGYNNSGTLALELLAWTSATARATALVLQNGVLVKSGATTRRYLGTFYTASTTTTEDSVVKRYVWNYYNRVKRPLQRFESTVSWTYTTATVRQANASASNQVDLVVGVAEPTVDLSLAINYTNSAAFTNVSFGIGEDSTTTYTVGQFTSTAAGTNMTQMVRLAKQPAIGRHFYSWNEWSTATATTTWYAAFAGAGSTMTAGLSGWTEG